MTDHELSAFIGDLADQVPHVDPPLGEVLAAGRAAAARRARRRGAWGVVAVAAGVAAVALGPRLVVQQAEIDVQQPAPAAAPVVPAGMKLIGAEGVAIAVPEEWTQVPAPVCAPQTPSTYFLVDDPGPIAFCSLALPRPVSHAEVVPGNSRGYPAHQIWCRDDGCDVTLERDGVAFIVQVVLSREEAQALLETIEASLQVLPEGWAAVPRWPLEKVLDQDGRSTLRPISSAAYGEMLEDAGLADVVEIIDEESRTTSPDQGAVVEVAAQDSRR